jgi:hypothetical protein
VIQMLIVMSKVCQARVKLLQNDWGQYPRVRESASFGRNFLCGHSGYARSIETLDVIASYVKRGQQAYVVRHADP